MKNDFCVFQIGGHKHDHQYRFIIAPHDLENEISENLPEGEFIDSYSTLDGILGGTVEIRLGNELLNRFICNTIEEPSAWQTDNLQNVFNETLAQTYNKQA